MTICNYCKRPASFTFKNGITCCSKNVSGCPEIKQRKSSTCIEKYGDANFKNIEKGRKTKLEKYGSPSFNNREKAKETTLEKYGVENVSQIDEIKYKKDATFQSNYLPGSEQRTKLAETRNKSWLSNDVNAIVNKSKNTCIEKYGVDNIQKLEHISQEVSRKNKKNAPERLAKARKTIRERYGVEYVSQVPEFHLKQQRARFKLYTLPSGKVIKVQGYEPRALDILLTMTTEDNIVTQRSLMPNIWYENSDHTRHRYFTDIMLVNENKLIEVKSTYTYSKDLSNNLRKKEACLSLGYLFEFWVFSKHGLQII